MEKIKTIIKQTVSAKIAIVLLVIGLLLFLICLGDITTAIIVLLFFVIISLCFFIIGYNKIYKSKKTSKGEISDSKEQSKHVTTKSKNVAPTKSHDSSVTISLDTLSYLSAEKKALADVHSLLAESKNDEAWAKLNEMAISGYQISTVRKEQVSLLKSEHKYLYATNFYLVQILYEAIEWRKKGWTTDEAISILVDTDYEFEQELTELVSLSNLDTESDTKILTDMLIKHIADGDRNESKLTNDFNKFISERHL